MKLIDKLNVLRNAGGKARTVGLTDATIERFAARFPELGAAIDDAHARFAQLQAEFPDIVAMDEAQQLLAVQEGFVNFYADDNVNPYVAIAARGPWLVTLKGAAAALQTGKATEVLQPVAESVRAQTGIAFITVMAPDGTRFTHTDPRQIGGHYLGTMEPALNGQTFTEFYTGTLGPSVRTIAPVRDGAGRVVGLVAAGITETTLTAQWRHQIPVIAAISLAALALSLAGTWLIRRRLLRQTHGLRPDQLRVMYEHHDAVLHSVSEGLIVLDRDGVALANDEARRLAWMRSPNDALGGVPATLILSAQGLVAAVAYLDAMRAPL